MCTVYLTEKGLSSNQQYMCVVPLTGLRPGLAQLFDNSQNATMLPIGHSCLATVGNQQYRLMLANDNIILMLVSYIFSSMECKM